MGCTVAGFDIIANELLVRLVRHHGTHALNAGVDKTVPHYLTATASPHDTGAPVFPVGFRELSTIPGVSPPMFHHSLIAGGVRAGKGAGCGVGPV